MVAAGKRKGVTQSKFIYNAFFHILLLVPIANEICGVIFANKTSSYIFDDVSVALFGGSAHGHAMQSGPWSIHPSS